MQISNPYKQFNQLIEQENFEPALSWGLRMAVAATLPVIWGVATGRMADAVWITLTAECICWVELKGSFGQSLRVLTGGIVLALVFATLGTLTANNIWLSLTSMLGVGFISGLFKNLGDRGSGLAICVYLLFIIANAFPVSTGTELNERILLVFAGGAWNTLVSVCFILFRPARQPYRRTVAIIWRSIAELIDTVAKGWDGNSTRNGIREIYLKEKEVRTAIDTSFHFYETMAHQVSKKNKHEYELAQVRKATALVAVHIIAISEELERINLKETNNSFRLKLYAVLKALQQTVDRMAVFVVTLKPEEELLLSSRINRLNKLIVLLKEYPIEQNDSISIPVKRIIQLTERSIRLIETSVTRLESMGSDLPVFRSYSLIKTIFVLHPKHWVRNLRLLFNLDTFTTRYAVRTAIAAGFALFISKWFEIERGYWIPFTVIIVLQPYFGATLKKAIDRIIGTILGGLAGGLLLYAHISINLEIALLFASLVLMIYFFHKNYAVSAFFITSGLVILFNIEMPTDLSLIIAREASTIGGATLAIIAGFTLLPNWDKKWLPVHLATAISANYNYFITTFFFFNVNTNWTRLKRNAESKNSNAFDSFNRYMQEPGFTKKTYSVYYYLITHNVRITRELNNINLELEHKNEIVESDSSSHQQRINICLYWFKKIMASIKELDPANRTIIHEGSEPVHFPYKLTFQQILYLDRMIIELKTMQQDIEKLAQRTN